MLSFPLNVNFSQFHIQILKIKNIAERIFADNRGLPTIELITQYEINQSCVPEEYCLTMFSKGSNDVEFPLSKIT